MALNLQANLRVEANCWVFETVAKMRLSPNPNNRDIGFLLGGTVAFDNTVFGMFGYDPTSNAPDNGTTIIASPYPVGRWIKLL